MQLESFVSLLLAFCTVYSCHIVLVLCVVDVIYIQYLHLKDYDVLL